MSGNLNPRIEVVGLALATILALGASSPRVLPGDRQESCEALCLDCAEDGEDEGSFCNFLFRLCCEASGGTPHDLCGCRIELAAVPADAPRRGP